MSQLVQTFVDFAQLGILVGIWQEENLVVCPQLKMYKQLFINYSAAVNLHFYAFRWHIKTESISAFMSVWAERMSDGEKGTQSVSS